MRFCQLVMGPAGSGKSRYCTVMQETARVAQKRTINVVNLDPAAENFDYEPLLDIRDLIQVDDVMEDDELKFGPNGGLVFCLEFLLENMNWLEENLQDLDDDYIIFDCPGQIELYTHLPVMKRFVNTLQSWNFRVCGVFLLDSHFMVDGAKFISGSMVALSAMVNLEVPHLNVLSKIDLLSKASRRQLDMFLHPDTRELTTHGMIGPGGKKFAALTEALGSVLENYSLVKFFPMDITDEENLLDLLLVVDDKIQFGEDQEVRTESFEDLSQVGQPEGDQDVGE